MAEAASQAFPKAERLRRRSEFERVYARGRKVVAPHLVLFALENSLLHSRLGITVTRKVGSAVERNRFKRRLREIFRRNKGAIPGRFDLVVNARAHIGPADYQRLQAEFLSCLEQLQGVGPERA
ncbi:MAG: ribonuclease P protein component [Acidobacteria bacterium]|nr:ribonuclease P protein component [Acidobacteriota bacterium]